MSTSGWCRAIPGARVPHGACRWALCSCVCHGENPQQNKGVEVNWGQQKTAPGGASTPNSRGLADADWSID